MQLSWLLIALAVGAAAQSSNVSDSLLWGAYRPNLYFGMRPQVPQSLMTGLVWFGTHDYQSFSKARHACDQGDGLDSYTWTEFDAREGGIQVLKDSLNNVKLTTELIKIPGGQHGGSWAARIKGEPIHADKPSRISTVFYMGLEGLGGLEMETDEDENGLEETVVFAGNTVDLDEFTIRVVDGPDNSVITTGIHAEAFANRAGKTHFAGYRVPPGNIWQAREYILSSVINHAKTAISPYQEPGTTPPDPSFVLQLPDEVFTGSTLYAVQKTFDGPFQFDVYFESASAKQKLSAAAVDRGIEALSASYNQRFDEVFPIPTEYPASDRHALREFSKAITSNLIGGIGYFYGKSIVDKSFSYEWDQEDSGSTPDDDEEQKGAHLTEPRSLLTATPSRSFFPRGFYWDEGFHLLHIGQWDNDLSLAILKDWVNLIDDDGWVAREQILGEEARSKVPSEFQTQVPTYANPPTLTMAVTAFIERLKRSAPGPSSHDLGLDYGMGEQVVMSGSLASTPSVHSRHLEDPELALSYLKSIYKPLKRHYDWFRRTQRGQIKQYARNARSRTEAYRWRGRSQEHVLTSGMDDFPRGPPHAGELHLDLISWMAFFSRTMREIAEFIGETDDAVAFTEIERATLDNIEDLHWNEEQQMYCDANVNEDDESYHVCDRGYLSLFPLLLGLLPADSPHLGSILDVLRDPDHLWSPYGLRSLSVSHPQFGQGENYWKGPIWIQMNFLALRALYTKYAVEDGPQQQRAKEIYDELRRNVVDNVFKEYQRTGYAWEQYDALSGEGRRSHPFTGWTSLVTLILSEKY
ncbi:glycoside hydrolase family 63 protein [Phlebiopsis gigantea 11061_1 CR5-6]|uniref:Mannosyl-oligosaccharide glucosidase n=1 Tax=Phlebiopsis gigantea (strain 11061_1 CR5-6) TaxID=745531 RepID=A0A0C3S7N7_PHLG1|nr:glycoside hydrolase family 63 protein [Phlebiopsis gigantea 11061_1 CR5-6]